MSRAIVLFAHGARDPEWARPMQRLADAVRMGDADTPVFTAFLEFMTPTLTEAMSQAVQGGASQVTVVPVFLAQGGHVRRDVPVMLDAFRGQHPEVAVDLRPAIGEAQSVIDAMAQVALART